MHTITKYKKIKQDFITGHTGTSIYELLMICACPSISGLLMYFEIMFMLNKSSWSSSKMKKSRGFLVVIEFIIIIIPIMISQTKYLYSWGLSLCVIQSLIALVLRYLCQPITPRRQNLLLYEPRMFQKKDKPFLTNYRSTVYIFTYLTILTVDFKLFPRRLVKTEANGYSLMDLGASSFIFSSGLVSSRPKSLTHSHSYILRLMLLFGLGFLRLVIHLYLDYHEHVSEYGIHWNFYFTLGIVHCLSKSNLILSLKYSWRILFMTLLMIGYQYVLSYWNIQEWIESSPRVCGHKDQKSISILRIFLWKIFISNREGILGCIGYYTIFAYADIIGVCVLWTKSSRNKILIRLLTIIFTLWSFYYIMSSYYCLKASRRSTNLSFITWSSLHNMILFFIYWCVYQVYVGQQSENKLSPKIFQSINRNSIYLFLFANIITGIINLSVNTVEVNDVHALGIITCYSCLVGQGALFMDNVRKKYWIMNRK